MDTTDYYDRESIHRFIEFLDQNRTTDFLKVNLLSEEETRKLDFGSLAKKKDELVSLAKAYQRLIRVVPEHDRDAALALLGQGVHSALQIAKMTRKDFMGRFASLLEDEKLADAIYQNALKKRGVILLQYMDVYQNNEPHIKAARFN